MDLILDVNIQIYPVDLGKKENVVYLLSWSHLKSSVFVDTM